MRATARQWHERSTREKVGDEMKIIINDDEFFETAISSNG
jgi:hypothetical protein